MSQYTFRTGHRYRAPVKLGFFERIASNAAIADKLTELGVVEVTVEGNGATRWAFGTWPGPDTTVELPSEIDASSITDLTP